MEISFDSERPAHGQQVFTAAALVHHRFADVVKVFLPRRAETKKFLPGYFEMTGGHIEFGEDMVEGLQREVMEEHGMRIRVGDPFHVFTYTNAVKGSHSIEVVYFAEFDDPLDQIELHPEDHSEFRWVGLDEIDDLKPMSDEERASVRKGLGLLNGAPLAFS